MKKTISLIIIFLLFSTLIFCGNPQQKDTNSPGGETTTDEGETVSEGETLLQERCTVCHSLDRVYPKAYDAGEWEEVVDRMIDHGAELNPQEKEILLDHLILE